MTSSSSRWRWLAAFATAAIGLGSTVAVAQIPSPPSTVFGSVTDQAGVVPENLPVQGYIGDKLCGTRGFTQFTGEGSARVTVYFVDVLSEEQTPGCGKEGAEIRVKIGDRFATQTTKWKRGPVQLDITFGNVTPAAIPTFTPAPTNTPRPNASQAAASTETPGAAAQSVGTIPAGSPGAGKSLEGGVTNSGTTKQSSSSSSSDGGGGGFPIWGGALLVLLAVAAVGGGVGYAMSRGRRDRNDSAGELGSIE